MFMRGQIGPCPQWMAELDCAEEVAAIQVKWMDTGKMLSWQIMPGGWRIIGPKFLGATEDDRLSLWYYTFPTLELFKEWALGAPEHVALHTKVLNAIAASGGQPPPMYSFHATDDPTADTAAIRAELKQMYRQIEATDWANMPAGSAELMMLGDHD